MLFRSTPITVANRIVGNGEYLIDMSNLICTAKLCHPIVGNVEVYRDLHHLTNTYVLTLAPYLERKLLTLPKVKAS